MLIATGKVISWRFAIKHVRLLRNEREVGCVKMNTTKDGKTMMNEDLPGQMTIFDVYDFLKPTPGRGGVFRFLRHGPHTLVPEAEKETREFLDKYGVPYWVTWSKDSLCCANCTWFDGSVCCREDHTCHREYGYLICDAFRQSIIERKPSTVGK